MHRAHSSDIIARESFGRYAQDCLSGRELWRERRPPLVSSGGAGEVELDACATGSGGRALLLLCLHSWCGYFSLARSLRMGA